MPPIMRYTIFSQRPTVQPVTAVLPGLFHGLFMDFSWTSTGRHRLLQATGYRLQALGGKQYICQEQVVLRINYSVRYFVSALYVLVLSSRSCNVNYISSTTSRKTISATPPSHSLLRLLNTKNGSAERCEMFRVESTDSSMSETEQIMHGVGH